MHDDDLVAEQLGLVEVVRGQQDGAVLLQLHYHRPDVPASTRCLTKYPRLIKES